MSMLDPPVGCHTVLKVASGSSNAGRGTLRCTVCAAAGWAALQAFLGRSSPGLPKRQPATPAPLPPTCRWLPAGAAR